MSSSLAVHTDDKAASILRAWRLWFMRLRIPKRSGHSSRFGSKRNGSSKSDDALRLAGARRRNDRSVIIARLPEAAAVKHMDGILPSARLAGRASMDGHVPSLLDSDAIRSFCAHYLGAPGRGPAWNPAALAGTSLASSLASPQSSCLSPKWKFFPYGTLPPLGDHERFSERA
jgi:hypothetical protein